MTMYSDGKIAVDDKGNTITVTYATDSAAPPSLSLKLNASAGNTLTGSLDGDYEMSGDLQGKVTLNLQISGTFTGTAPNVMRVAGSTTVTGTAVSSSGGMYMVNTTL
jgi:autotransporter translocation and assembly factor TamB